MQKSAALRGRVAREQHGETKVEVSLSEDVAAAVHASRYDAGAAVEVRAVLICAKILSSLRRDDYLRAEITPIASLPRALIIPIPMDGLVR